MKENHQPLKILCPTDFSNASYNAIQWTIEYCKQLNSAEIEIMHCLNIRNRSDMFTKLNDVVKERAIHDLEVLKDLVEGPVDVKTTIFDADPKSFIPVRANRIDADIIITGSTGLSALKEITFGSVADYVARHAQRSTIVIPEAISFSSIERIVLGIGTDSIIGAGQIRNLYRFFGHYNPQMYLTQVVRPGKSFLSISNTLQDAFSDWDVQTKIIESEGPIMSALNNFAHSIQADLISTIHQKKGWIARLMHPSVTKKGMIDLQKPLLVFPEE